ncbi:MAG: hypothetical protein NW241_02800 [Bacteroidia bacterium]|nr:hypothetical protein [Bacteroidia bacterium]
MIRLMLLLLALIALGAAFLAPALVQALAPGEDPQPAGPPKPEEKSPRTFINDKGELVEEISYDEWESGE